MAGIDDLQIRLRNARQAILQALPDIAIENTISAKDIIENKIRKVGFGVKYSDNKVPAWFFLKSTLNNTGLKFIQKKIEDKEETNWQELKSAEGLPTGHVDLSHTNKMWASLTPMEPQISGNRIIVGLGSGNQEGAKVLNYNRARYGDFMGQVLGKPEMQILGEVVLAKIGQILQDNGINT